MEISVSTSSKSTGGHCVDYICLYWIGVVTMMIILMPIVMQMAPEVKFMLPVLFMPELRA